jgi:dipeptidyl aminopeptidase/acylaminoacyl peptidase
VSRDGRRLAAGYDGEHLRVVTIPDRELLIPGDVAPAMDPMMADDPMMPGDPMMPAEPPPPPPKGAELGYGWGTFSPDGTRLLYAHKGALSLLDVDDGQKVLEVALPAGHLATHPDWSPDGRHVAVAYVAGDRAGNKDVTGSSIARLPVNDDGTFGEPEVLVASEDKDDTLFFPVYSPDSRWLAFARGHGKSKDNASAELFLVDAEGAGEPIALDRLNHRVRSEDGVLDLGNTMPTWAPSTEPDVFWLAFSSIRDYGDVLVDAARDQLWGAAIDPARIDAGDDPSYSAFWMPFQDIDEGNHRAFWSLAPEQECPSTSELCDDLDSDCDGVVDEDCCTPAPELCGNGVDDDCNGVPDEHCDCGEIELCDNNIDDDCDVTVDEDCLI